MANRRTARVVVCAGVENAESGVGEAVDEGVGSFGEVGCSGSLKIKLENVLNNYQCRF